jgi:hypothetical protein
VKIKDGGDEMLTSQVLGVTPVGAASSREKKSHKNLNRGWKPLPQKFDVKSMKLICTCRYGFILLTGQPPPDP